MSTRYRKTTPKVVSGQVQPKQRRTRPRYADSPRIAIERSRPGSGYRHVLHCSDVFNFVTGMPHWEELSFGLATIQLAEGTSQLLGWYRPRMVAICAMPHDLKLVFDQKFFYRDKDFFDRLNVEYPEIETDDPHGTGDMGQIVCSLRPEAARCYQLLRVLPHELGHHHDLMTNKRKWCSRGEEYAERYGREMQARLWDRYLHLFADPR
jgi:hypothetical protein